MKDALNRAGALVAACALSLLPAGARAGNVNSVDIIPADGTTGQTLTAGSGVKTGHIQDGAVTDAKIAGVSASKITGTIPAAQVEGGVFMKKYSHVVVVAKSGGDFTDPVSALLAIGDASPSNPYLVKIMPGVYDIGTSLLQMKSGVDVEGSGEGVTVVRGLGSTAGQYRAVVRTAVASELRWLTVELIAGAPLDPARGEFLAVISNHVPELGPTGTSSLRHVTVNGVANGANHLDGVLYILHSEVTLSDVTVRVSGAAYSTGISANTEYWVAAPGETPAIVARGVDVRVAAGTWTRGVYMCGDHPADLRDSSVRASGGSVVGLFVCGNVNRIANVSVDTEGPGDVAIHAYSDPGVSTRRATYVDHSSLRSGAGAYGAIRNSGQDVFAAYSKVEGPIVKDGAAVTTCLGLYGGAYQPVSCP